MAFSSPFRGLAWAPANSPSLGGLRHQLYLCPLSPFPLVNGGVCFVIITIVVNYPKHTETYRNSTTNTRALITLSGRCSCSPSLPQLFFYKTHHTAEARPSTQSPRIAPFHTLSPPVRSLCLLLYTHVPCVPTHAFPPALWHELSLAVFTSTLSTVCSLFTTCVCVCGGGSVLPAPAGGLCLRLRKCCHCHGGDGPTTEHAECVPRGRDASTLYSGFSGHFLHRVTSVLQRVGWLAAVGAGKPTPLGPRWHGCCLPEDNVPGSQVDAGKASVA